MSRNLAGLLTTIMLFVSSAHAQDTLRDATPTELAAIKAGMETELKDADSAKFLNVKFKGDEFCGLVNAKNSYGAYAGYVPITGMVFDLGKGKKIAVVMGLGSPEGTRALCEKNGYQLPPA